MPYRFDPYPDRGEIAFLRRRDVGDTVRAAFVFFRRNAKPLMSALFGIAGPIAMAMGIAMTSLMSRFQVFEEVMDPFGNPDPEMFTEVDWGSLAPTLLILLLGWLFLSVLGPLVAFGFVRLYRKGVAGNEMTISGVWESLQPKIWPVFSIVLLFVGIFLFLALLNVVPLLGTLAFIGLLIYVYPIFTVAYVTRVFEADSALSALERTRELVRGRWGYAAGVVLVVSLVGVVFMFAFMIPATIWDGIVRAIYGESRPFLRVVSMAAGQVLQLIGSLTASLFTTIGACFLFGSLKEEREGSSMMEELEVFSASKPEEEERAPSEGADAPSTRRERSSQPGEDDSAPSKQGGFRGGGFSG